METAADRLPEFNRSLVLKSISQKSHFTKMDVVRETHLSLPTISEILTRLQCEGFLYANGSGKSNGGRPPALFRFNPTARYAFGIVLEPPEIYFGLVDLQNNLLQMSSAPIQDSTSSDMLCELVVQTTTQILTTNHVADYKLIGIGLGLPGYLDRDTGIWLGYLPMPFISHLDLPNLLTNTFNTPVFSQHASALQTAAELRRVPALANGDVLAIIGSEGIKASIVVDGRILSGDHGNFGRIGHFVVVENGRSCYCGDHGCLEAYASGRAIRAEIKNCGSGITDLPGLNDPLLSYKVFRLAAEGHPVCRCVVEKIVPYMAAALSQLINLTDIGRIVLLGSYAEGGNYLSDLIHHQIASQLPKIPGLRLSVQIGNRLSTGDLVISAAILATQAFLGQQSLVDHRG